MSESAQEVLPGHPTGKVLVGLALGALGVVFGDIGTSPLYAVKETFSGPHAFPVTPTNVMGVLSLIFWSLAYAVERGTADRG